MATELHKGKYDDGCLQHITQGHGLRARRHRAGTRQGHAGPSRRRGQKRLGCDVAASTHFGARRCRWRNDGSENWANDLTADAGQAPREFFDLVNRRSIVGRLPLRRVPFFTQTSSLDEGAAISWTGEGGAVRISNLMINKQTGLSPLKVAAAIIISDELLASSNPNAEALIRNELVRACAEAIDVAGECRGEFVESDGFEYQAYLKPGKIKRPSMDWPAPAYEKISADLAYDLSCPVPAVQVWERELGSTGEYACYASL